jgi:hypothetical protein
MSDRTLSPTMGKSHASEPVRGFVSFHLIHRFLPSTCTVDYGTARTGVRLRTCARRWRSRNKHKTTFLTTT